MAAIDDLISQVTDPALRDRLISEWRIASQDKTFGLVFERHLPELLPIFKAKPRKGDLVCRRGASITDVRVVKAVIDGKALCNKRGEGPRTSKTEAEECDLDELLVVREFGDAIFPALAPVGAVSNGNPGGTWHTLIEADNYHALQLLEYLYEGKVDCIYIDPPYNSGARDWKYNNDYVDSNDFWRHSKWLAFMEKRLKLAQRLLNPLDSVLIMTIDEKEYLHAGMLLQQVFKNARIQMVSTLINPASVPRAGAFGRSDEYIFFVFIGTSAPQRVRLAREWVSSKGRTHTGKIRWDLLRRSGTNAERTHSPGCFYPIYVDPNDRKIRKVGSALPEGTSMPPAKAGLVPVLPIRKDGSEGNWQWSRETLVERMKEGRVRVGGNEKRGFVIYILKDGEFAKIKRGEFELAGKGINGELEVTENDASFVIAVPGSQWRISTHDATQYGSRLLADILPGDKFPFPKSLYATRDALRFFVTNKPNALIVDFFAGSGTTLHAVNLLNATYGGARRCIMVTNNEVSATDAEVLRGRGFQPGDEQWENVGICRSVTWPRTKASITGKRSDRKVLTGEYLTGKPVEQEIERNFYHIGFVDPATLTTLSKKKQVAAIVRGLPQSEVKAPARFIVSEEHSTSILFDPEYSNEWLEALEGQEHITDLYVVTASRSDFEQLKTKATKILGPAIAMTEERRPLASGFESNVEYFRLEFLDKDRVSLKRAFREILPLLWLKAGAIGRRPELSRADSDHDMVFSDGSNFAVLLKETRFRRFQATIQARSNVTHVFIVTDSDESFKAMANDLRESLNPQRSVEIVQLYRDYLANFEINTTKTI